MGAFDSLLRCTIGGEAPGGMAFQLASYTKRVAAVTRSGYRVGSQIEVTGEGWIEAGDASSLAAAIDAAEGRCSIDGQNIRIIGPGDVVEVDLPAAMFVDGGPSISFEVAPSDALIKRFNFVISGRTARDDGAGGGSQPSFTETIATGPDGLRMVTRRGVLMGSNAVNRFEADVWGPFVSQFAGWVLSREVERNLTGNELSFTMVAVELVQPLPAAGTVVDGEVQVTSERDEQQRLVRTWDFDLQVAGNPVDVLTAIRPDGVILREQSSYTMIHGIRLRASFVTLLTGEGDGLLNWSQTISIQQAVDTWETIRYPGVSPVLVKQSPRHAICRQSGTAIGLTLYPRPDDPLYPDRLLEPPEISTRYMSDSEHETSWSYVMALPEGMQGIPGTSFNFSLLRRPRVNTSHTPQFYGGA